MSSPSPTTQPLVHHKDPGSQGMNNNDGGGEGGFSWLTALGFGFLTFNSGMAIYRSDGDRGSVAFVLTSYIDLVLLFACLRLFEKAPRDSSRREYLKVFVWLLTTLLTVMFSYKVAAIMPSLVAVIVWAMAFATIGGGFYAFFVHQDKAALLEQANR